jgi:hypothetical protein
MVSAHGRALYLSVYRVRALRHQRRSLSVADGTVAGEGMTDPGDDHRPPRDLAQRLLDGSCCR